VSGHIALAGRDLLALSEPEMRQVRGNEVGIIFQDPAASLNPVMRVGRQVRETIEAHHALTSTAARQRSVDMLRAVRIPEPEMRARDYPHQYSGGMRQRVMIAIGSANRPQLLIADEPTTALDVTVQAQIMELLRSMNEAAGTAIILITHNIALVSRFCRRVFVMYAGRIVEEGTTADVLITPRHPYTRGLLDSVPANTSPHERLRQIPGMTPSLLELAPGCAFRSRCPRAQADCEQDPEMRPYGAIGQAVRCFYPLEAV
jgi:oligopeptide/dipeptide ABC transporter ATP-binding protein